LFSFVIAPTGGAAIGGEQMIFDAVQHHVNTLLDFARPPAFPRERADLLDQGLYKAQVPAGATAAKCPSREWSFAAIPLSLLTFPTP
jgi:hypothetical protein